MYMFTLEASMMDDWISNCFSISSTSVFPLEGWLEEGERVREEEMKKKKCGKGWSSGREMRRSRDLWEGVRVVRVGKVV